MDAFCLIAVYFTLAFFSSVWGRGWRQRKIVKIIFLPSLLLHALFRTLGAFLSMSPLQKVEFFGDKQPFLKRGPTRLPYLGHLLSALATHLPLFGVFFYLSAFLPVERWKDLALPAHSSVEENPLLLLSYVEFFIHRTPFLSVPFAVALYAFAGLSLCYDLSVREYLAVIVFSLIGCWLCGLLAYLGAGFSLFSRGWFLLHFYIPEWWGIASSFVCLTALSTALVGLSRLVGFCASKLFLGRRRPTHARPAGLRRRTRTAARV